MLKTVTDKSKPGFKAMIVLAILLVIAFVFHYIKTQQGGAPTRSDWPEYNGGPDRNHYSFLTQITPGNVGQLEKIWEYRSGGVDTVKNQTQM